MIQVIETNLSIDEDDTIRDHQSRVVEVEDWDTYCKAFKEYSGEAVYFKVGLEADFMRLEYDEEQEKRLRITEIEAILNNELYENEVEEHCLDIELQFLQGNENVYGEPYAFIGSDNVSFDVIYEEENNRYSATLYNKEGNPQLPYLNSENIEKLVEQILKNEDAF